MSHSHMLIHLCLVFVLSMPVAVIQHAGGSAQTPHGARKQVAPYLVATNFLVKGELGAQWAPPMAVCLPGVSFQEKKPGFKGTTSTPAPLSCHISMKMIQKAVSLRLCCRCIPVQQGSWKNGGKKRKEKNGGRGNNRYLKRFDWQERRIMAFSSFFFFYMRHFLS